MQQRGDWSESSSRWHEVTEKFPAIIWGHLGEAEMLISLGRTEDAQAAIKALEARFPQWAEAHIERLTEKLAAESAGSRARAEGGFARDERASISTLAAGAPGMPRKPRTLGT